MASVTMLGTGNFLSPRGRNWNSFLVEGEHLTVLFEPAPSVLQSLRRLDTPLEELDGIVVSHFHPDHTFGWPFLLLELLLLRSSRPLWVIGPPGVEEFFTEMMRLGSVLDIARDAKTELDMHFVETGGGSELHELAVPFSLSAVQVEHVPELECFGYVIDVDGTRLGYSGDTRPCEGLEVLSQNCDTLVVECNGVHAATSHMDTTSLLALASRVPELRLIATHLGKDVSGDVLPGVEVPDDLARIEL